MNIVKIAILLKADYTYNSMLIKVPISSFAEIKELTYGSLRDTE
jgi:hypothetical protein